MMKGELDMKVNESVFWTDSTCVLKYIGNENTRFQTFVANRVSKIQDATELCQWKYVNTSSNRADDASRGLAAREILKKERWLKGPDFLWKSCEHWPNQEEIMSDISERDPELRKNATRLPASHLMMMMMMNLPTICVPDSRNSLPGNSSGNQLHGQSAT
jgi:hypothetical protein